MPSEFLSSLTRCFRDIKPWGRQLQSFNRCRSLREESCQAKRIKERRERVRMSNCELMASDFLGPVPEIFVSVLIPVSQIPDPQYPSNKPPLSLKSVGVGLLSLVVQT